MTQPIDEPITFSSLKLAEPLQRALNDKKYTHPSPIQAKSIPHLLEGRDIIGTAQTGTGKTAAFALPILQRLSTNSRAPIPKNPKALILTPTRELAAQIGDSFKAYGRYLSLRHTVVYGGVGYQPQVHALSSGVEILIATPGRLMDLVERGSVSLFRVEVFVLDEADRMLDMGFIQDIKRIIPMLQPNRQSMLFSATMPPAIIDLARTLLKDPVNVSVSPAGSTADKIEQRVCYVQHHDKLKLLIHLLNQQKEGLVLIFARTKHGASRLADKLSHEGIRAEAIHGDKSQAARQKALDNFKRQTSRVLVATDVAARGIDVKGITLVVNYDIPHEPESYVHRIGRTARAGAVGLAVALCEPAERPLLRDIEKLIRQTIPRMENQPFTADISAHDEASALRPPQHRPRHTREGSHARHEDRDRHRRPHPRHQKQESGHPGSHPHSSGKPSSGKPEGKKKGWISRIFGKLNRPK